MIVPAPFGRASLRGIKESREDICAPSLPPQTLTTSRPNCGMGDPAPFGRRAGDASLLRAALPRAAYGRAYSVAVAALRGDASP